MKQRRDPVTSRGLLLAQAEKLSSTMESNLRRLYASEAGGKARSYLPIAQAQALERRGLITARYHLGYVYGGMECALTSKGRRVARVL